MKKLSILLAGVIILGTLMFTSAAKSQDISNPNFFKRIGDAVYFLNAGWGFSANDYVNFGRTAGSSGYGLRSSGGTMQYKNASGTWADVGSSQGSACSLWASSTDYVYPTSSYGIMVNGTSTLATTTVTNFTVSGTSTLATTSIAGQIILNGSPISSWPSAGVSYWSRSSTYVYLTTSTDKVGIETTTPPEKLFIGDGAGTSATWVGIDSPSNKSAGIRLYDTGSYKWAMFRVANTGDFGIYNYNLSSYALSIVSSTGYVGIGTTTPNNLLQVYDLVYFGTGTDTNTKIGWQAGKNIVSGAVDNVYLGYQAGLGASSGGTNAADYNVGIGYWTLKNNKTGESNMAIGYGALSANTDGDFNVALGVSALVFNSTGNQNTAIGAESLYSNQTGSYNVAVGNSALYTNDDGEYNIGIGTGALVSNLNGDDNVGIGRSALGGLYDDDYRNIGIGAYAGFRSDGSDQLFINNRDRTTAAGEKANSILYGVMSTTAQGQSLTINASTTVSLNLRVAGNINATDITGSGTVQGSILTDGSATIQSGYATFTGAVVAPYESWFGDSADDRVVISEADFGALGHYPLIKFNSTGQTYGNTAGAIQDMLSIIGINVASTLAFTNNNGTVVSTFSFNEGTGVLNYANLIGGITATFNADYLTADNDITATGGDINATAGNIRSFSGTVQGQTLTDGYSSFNTGFATITRNLTLDSTSVIYQNATSLLHTFGTDSLFIGPAAGNFTQSGATYNVGIGTQALDGLTSGDYNMALGYQALTNLTSGQNETALGAQALTSLQTGNANTAIGTYALYSLTTGGIRNIAIGLSALYYLNSAGYNVAIGSQAGTNPNDTTNGDYATKGGTYNTFIGYSTGQSVVSSTNISNAVAIGARALVGCSNCMALGGTDSTRQVRVGIYNTTPTAQLDIVSDAAVHTGATRGIRLAHYAGSATTGGLFSTYRARGTPTVPLANENGDILSSFLTGAYDGTSWLSTAIYGTAVSGATSTGIIPTDFIISLSSSTFSGLLTGGMEKFRVTYDGRVSVGSSTAPSLLTVYASASNTLTANLLQVGTTTNDKILFISNSGSIYMGSYNSGNYIQIENDGTLVMAGNATVWDDIRVPLTTAKAAGVKDPGFDVFSPTSTARVYAFDGGTTEEEIFFSAQVPHGYKIGTNLRPHIHLSPSDANTGVIVFRLDCDWSDRNGYFTSTSVEYATTTISTDSNHQSLYTDFSTTTAVNFALVSGIIDCKLSRTPTGGDTYPSDAFVHEIDFHYEADTIGSRTETTK